MKNGSMVHRCGVLVAIMPVVLATVAFAGDLSTIRVGPEQAIRGITPAEHLDRQAELHTRLMAEMPKRALDAPVRVELTKADRDDLATPTAPPLRIGVVKSIVPVNVVGLGRGNHGVYEDTHDGGFTWATTISSQGAEGIRVHVKGFSLPVGAAMYIYSPEGNAQGPYEGVGRHGNGDFWTHTVFSETAVIQVRYEGPASAQDRANVRFIIDRVGVIRPHRPFAVPHASWSDNYCDNPSCVLDANCGSVAPASQAAIAKMEWIAGAYIVTCTGGLIADTDNSTQRNLFLTANHCISKSRAAGSMETYFDYTTASCNGECPPWPSTPDTIGATILATSRDGDYTLLELDEDPPSGRTFLGWNNSSIASSNGADLHRVSNPNYGPQVYSHHEVDASTGTCSGLPRGEFIYSVDRDGATDGGSSGSPVVNSSGEIVGQLYGCCGYNCGDVCDSGSNNTVDGALAFYYDDVAEFLNPTGCIPVTEVCDNGADDDCDDLVDCADPDCDGDPACDCVPEPEVCDDGIDNDCDTLVDCDDGDCAADPICACGQPGDPCSSNADCCKSCDKKTWTCR